MFTVVSHELGHLMGFSSEADSALHNGTPRAVETTSQDVVDLVGNPACPPPNYGLMTDSRSMRC